MPYLMAYTFWIVDEILFSLVDLNKDIKEYRDLRVLLKFMYWACEHDKFNGSEQILSTLGKGGNCENCGAELDLGIHDLKLHFDTDFLPCV